MLSYCYKVLNDVVSRPEVYIFMLTAVMLMLMLPPKIPRDLLQMARSLLPFIKL